MTSPRSGSTATTTPARTLAVLGLSKVPRVAAIFWITKALTTAMGESTSDFLVHATVAGGGRAAGFRRVLCRVGACSCAHPRYTAARYWFAVSMVGVFGTMAADVLHVGFGVPYPVSAVLFVVVLAGVFVVWHRRRGDAVGAQHRDDRGASCSTGPRSSRRSRSAPPSAT